MRLSTSHFKLLLLIQLLFHPSCVPVHAKEVFAYISSCSGSQNHFWSVCPQREKHSGVKTKIVQTIIALIIVRNDSSIVVLEKSLEGVIVLHIMQKHSSVLHCTEALLRPCLILCFDRLLEAYLLHRPP